MKNKLLIVIAFIICVISLAACNNKNTTAKKNETEKRNATTASVSSNNGSGSSSKTTEPSVKPDPLKAITDESLKQEILSEQTNNLSLKGYFENINNKPEKVVYPFEVAEVFSETLSSLNVPATKGEVELTIMNQISNYTGYLYEDDSNLYLSYYQVVKEQTPAVQTYYFDFEDFLSKYGTESVFEEIFAMLGEETEEKEESTGTISQSELPAIVPGFDIATIFQTLKDIKIDETWFDEDEELDGLYHLNIEKVLMAILGTTQGQAAYATYQADILQICETAPDVYFTYFNGNVRTFGIKALLKSEDDLQIDKDSKVNGELSLNVYGALHYDEEELTKVELNAEVKAKGTSTVTEFSTTILTTSTDFDIEVKFNAVLDLENVSLTVTGNQKVINSVDEYSQTVTASESLTVTMGSIKGTIIAKNEVNNGIEEEVSLNCDLAVSKNFDVTGGFEFVDVKTTGQNTYVNALKFNATKEEELPEFISDSKENALCVNSFVENFLNQYVTPTVKATKAYIEYNNYSFDGEEPTLESTIRKSSYFFKEGTTYYFAVQDEDETVTTYSFDLETFASFIDNPSFLQQVEDLIGKYSTTVQQYCPGVASILGELLEEGELSKETMENIMACLEEDEDHPNYLVLNVEEFIELTLGSFGSDIASMYATFYDLLSTEETVPLKIYFAMNENQQVGAFVVRVCVNTEFTPISEGTAIIGNVNLGFAIEFDYDEEGQLSKLAISFKTQDTCELDIVPFTYDTQGEDQTNPKIVAGEPLSTFKLSSNLTTIIDVKNMAVTIDGGFGAHAYMPTIKIDTALNTDNIVISMAEISGSFGFGFGYQELVAPDDQGQGGSQDVSTTVVPVWVKKIDFSYSTNLNFSYNEEGEFGGGLQVWDENNDVCLLLLVIYENADVPKEVLIDSYNAQPVDRMLISKINDFFSQQNVEEIYFSSVEDAQNQLASYGYEFEDMEANEETGILEGTTGTLETNTITYTVIIIVFDSYDNAVDYFDKFDGEDLCLDCCLSDNIFYAYTSEGPVELWPDLIPVVD